MKDFLTWLSSTNTTVAFIVIITLAAVVGMVCLIYIIAFLQGRSVSFWPPNVGNKPTKIKDNDHKKTKNDYPNNAKLLVSAKEAHERVNLLEYLPTLQTLDLMGYNLKRLLYDLRDPMAEAVINGAIIRILLVDFTSIAGKIMQEHTNRPQLLLPDATTGLENIQDIQKLIQAKSKVIGRLEVRLTSWLPSCNMIIIDANKNFGIAKIGINAPSFRQPTTGRLSLILTHDEHSSELEYFAKQFNAVWEDDSTEWDNNIPQIGKI